MSGSDQRLTKRVTHVAKIRYCAGDHDDYRSGRMYNYSTTGMYLEMSYPPPKLGAQLLIEVLDPVAEEFDQEDRDLVHTCYYAKVIWKKNLHNTVGADYGVGLHYLHPPIPEE